MRITGLARISLTTGDAQGLARFYVEAIGFTRIDQTRIKDSRYGVPGGALIVTLSLGAQQIELVQFDQTGAAYPQPTSSHDPWFQHVAIVVRDIDAAYRHLLQAASPIAISTNGPVTLPASSGGVRAVKLRDPDLHPFELLEFPRGAIPARWQDGVGGLGIDHSAIIVSETARSVAFYGGLGLSVSARSLNLGLEQAELDAAPDAHVEVTALSPQQDTPHVELLCYRAPPSPSGRPVAPNDIAASRLIFDADTDTLLADPDGHRLVLRTP